MFDLLIRNGIVIDGSGGRRFFGDVGIEGDRITLVGKADGATAKTEIDATGKVVCPGFVDPHSHADLSIFRVDHEKLLEPLVRQGITTFVGGNCGMSLAPIQHKNREMIKAYIEVFTRFDFDRDIQWETTAEFFDTLESRGLLLNAAMLAPHGIIRLNETGPDMRYATDDEVENMAQALDRSLDAGAIGLSTGLQYIPGSQSNTRELMRLAQVVKQHNGIFTSHLRSYSNTLDRAIDEIVAIAEQNDIAAQISHLFWIPDAGVLEPLFRPFAKGLVALAPWWVVPLPIGRAMKAHVNRIMAARQRGVRIGVDVMPTTTGFTHMLAFFPPWAVAGGREAIIQRLQDPEARRKIRHSIEHGHTTWPHVEGDSWSLNLFKLMGWSCAHIMSVGSEKNRRYEGMNLVEIAAERRVHPLDAACDLLIEEHGHVLVFESMGEPEDNFTEQTMLPAIAHPEAMISTDTILMGIGHPSHLFFGCYPKVLGRYVREKRLLPLETAVRKATALPAEHFNLKGRGKIEKNAYADVVVFDFHRIESRATFRDPAHFPNGIEHVIINGRHVLDQGVFHPDPKPGRLLRHGG